MLLHVVVVAAAAAAAADDDNDRAAAVAVAENDDGAGDDDGDDIYIPYVIIDGQLLVSLSAHDNIHTAHIYTYTSINTLIIIISAILKIHYERYTHIVILYLLRSVYTDSTTDYAY